MDDRGRLAQSLTPKVRRRTRARTQKSFISNGRWRRITRRWLTPVLEFHAPRGAGPIAAGLLILASAGYGVVRGHHVVEIAAEVQDICDTIANGAGFHIAEVALVGQTQLSRDDILNTAGITGSSSLLFLDAAQARERLMGNPWIAQARVLKLYPGRLSIEIKERKAFALWQKEGKVAVISADGTVLEPFVSNRFAALPLVVGTGAQGEAQGFLAMLAHYPDVGSIVEAAVLVAERRWNLRLKNGIEVRLPETDPDHALQILVDLDRDKKLLTRDIVAIDLRLTDRVTVRLSDSAAQARDDALKDAAARDKKGKRKGSDA
jgi:cell division protein FtsQ